MPASSEVFFISRVYLQQKPETEYGEGGLLLSAAGQR